MKNLLSLVFIGLVTLSLCSQKLSSEYQWQEEVSIKDLGISESSDDDTVLLKKIITEFDYDENSGALLEYDFIHKMIYVNSQDEISNNNKIYIRVNDNEELMDYNARVIKSNDEIQNLGQDALREGIDEDENKYTYFAISGAEEGSVIEYYYLVKRLPRYTGRAMKLQEESPVKNLVFKLASPLNLEFATHSTFGFPSMSPDTSFKELNLLSVQALDVPPIPEELFANSGGNEMTLFYHLDANHANGMRNMFSYANFTQILFESLNEELTKKENKLLEKFLKESNYTFGRDEEDKIRKIEHAVKTSFYAVDASSPELERIESIFNIRYFNEDGAMLMFYHLFKKAGIDFELVLTSNRYDSKFDKDFESYSFLHKYLFYFPGIKKYLMPDGQLYRVGIVPPAYIHNNGLFIKRISVAGIESAISEIRFIEAPTAAHSQQIMDISTTINPDDTEYITVEFNQELSGYYAHNFQPFFDLIQPDKKGDFEKEIILGSFPNAEIDDLIFQNSKLEDVQAQPLIVKSTIKLPEMVDRAGDKLLFKIGELIGPQVEMYQEKERQLDIENDYNRTYLRKIEFTIPEGFDCKNLDDLNINVTPFNSSKDECQFVSSYIKEGNKISIDVNETYNSIELDKTHFEDYRKVINAAADFNKVVLVLEKN